MKELGWVMYSYDSIPPHGIKRYTYYKICAEKEKIFIKGEDDIKIELPIEVIKTIFTPANGYETWEGLLQKEEVKENGESAHKSLKFSTNLEDMIEEKTLADKNVKK